MRVSLSIRLQIIIAFAYFALLFALVFLKQGMQILPFTVEKLNYEKTPAKPVLSLSISIYNNVLFFSKVWASLEVQTFKDFEVIIADDGSKAENKEAIINIIKSTSIPTTYVWQEDRGFHKNEVLNKGIQQMTSEYVVFIDGDCVLHSQFLEDHYNHRQNGKILAGRRANLSAKISNDLTIKKIKDKYLDKNYWYLMWSFMHEHDAMASRGLRLNDDFLWRLNNRKKRTIVGSNFSVFLKDLKAVNGFDMRYCAAGTGEDSDIEYRLNLNGVETLPFCHRGIQYHLWHKLQTRDLSCEKLFIEVQKEQKANTEFGLNLL